ncbi:stage III sporulation protein AH [Scopulibacillus darangshiensis]|uniref:Stage III sporulation protein AH n=1 Tax=Scopulibacillus darangshiensis TaxID=442528 RepID=A0A4R2P875_9BACL|nr:SpoIIIAH-like family protein [Scopulibacillus darangshiensis]TCP31180.1 stage III sporulation protein AH [Scopulibacillus darangshiensis]
MVLKKQTVWLLTMLSLIIVLSVYYITSPGGSTSDQAADTKQNGQKAADVAGKPVNTKVTSEDQLAEYSLKKADDQKEKANEYQSVITSDNSTVADVNKAYDKMEALQTTANNEKLLEDMIKSKGYADAVVSTDENNVTVYVASEDMSSKQANEIQRMAHKYFGGQKLVQVNYAIAKK